LCCKDAGVNIVPIVRARRDIALYTFRATILHGSPSMIPVQSLFLVAGVTLGALLAAMAGSSVREGEKRAARISLMLLAALVALWAWLLMDPDAPGWLPPVILITVAAVAVLFFLPVNPPTPMAVRGVTERVDERDIMFSREEYAEGSRKHEIYYAMRPENLKADEAIRRLPGLLKRGGRFYDPEGSGRIEEIFREIENLTRRVDGPVAAVKATADAAGMTAAIKRRILDLGADAVGVARLDPMYVYSHVGRGPEEWGAPITNDHAFAVAFTLEMAHGSVARAPRLPITHETAIRYLQGARISIELAEWIRGLGHPARAHIAGSNYQIMLPPVAQDAGLGELGRMGYLISPRLGARVRLGAVTTDLPLVTDRPRVFGVQDFCDICRKCADNCPSGAIPPGGKETVRGVEKWRLNIEKCMHYWRVIGTDCGLCMRVCPYSHPPTGVHNLVRAGIGRSAFARRLALRGDDFFYGRKVSPRQAGLK
jgi:reductive dehalogenase